VSTQLSEKLVKAGYKTSEFWVAVVTANVPLLNAAFGLNLPVEAIASIAGVAAAYILSRGVAKK